MLRRRKWRLLLPTIQTVVFILLIDWQHPDQFGAQLPNYRVTSVMAQEGPQFDLTSDIYRVPPLRDRIAVALNLPAFLLSTWLVVPALLLIPKIADNPLFQIAAMGAFVPIIWYVIGRRLDLPSDGSLLDWKSCRLWQKLLFLIAAFPPLLLLVGFSMYSLDLVSFLGIGSWIGFVSWAWLMGKPNLVSTLKPQ